MLGMIEEGGEKRRGSEREERVFLFTSKVPFGPFLACLSAGRAQQSLTTRVELMSNKAWHAGTVTAAVITDFAQEWQGS